MKSGNSGNSPNSSNRANWAVKFGRLEKSAPHFPAKRPLALNSAAGLDWREGVAGRPCGVKARAVGAGRGKPAFAALLPLQPCGVSCLFMPLQKASYPQKIPELIARFAVFTGAAEGLLIY